MKTILTTVALVVATVAASASAFAAPFGHHPMHGRIYGIIIHRPIHGIIIHPRFPRGIVVDRPFGGFPGPFTRGVPVERFF